jgi:hypothetical protein
VRDPWFPIALILIILLAAWLGIVGPMPHGVATWLQSWQTLAGACVASIAALIAVLNTTRSLRHAENLEKHRRSRKHAALRAMLPLALAQLSTYAERSARALDQLVSKCIDEKLPAMTADESLIQSLPSETLKIFADFIEYADRLNVGIMESTVATIQIFDSRVRSLVESNRSADDGQLVLRINLENYIIDAASIYAGAACHYDYARRREQELPNILTWDAVKKALRNMRLYDDGNPRLYAAITRGEGLSAGPFEKLKAN